VQREGTKCGTITSVTRGVQRGVQQANWISIESKKLSANRARPKNSHATQHAILALPLRAPALRRWHADRELAQSDSRDPGVKTTYLGLPFCFCCRRSRA
jgi:hypothetical protein